MTEPLRAGFCLCLVALWMKTHRTATRCMETACANGPAVRPSLEIFRHFSSKWSEFQLPRAKMVFGARRLEPAALRNALETYSGRPV